MSPTEPAPRVTMVVALFNEAATIAECLGSLAGQDYPADRLEVLVYDGGSSDGSREIAERVVAVHPGWAVRANPRRIQAAAWNMGIEAATGDIVGIVSGHARLAPSYVRRTVQALDETGADMVGGPVRAIGEGTIGRAAAIAISTPFGVGGARHHYLTERANVDTVFMGTCHRSTYLAFPFDESMVRNQDDELSYRLLDAGGRIVCDPAIESSYRNRSSLGALWRQYRAYGRWKVPVLLRHPRRARIRHLAPAALVSALVLGAVLSPVWGLARAGTALVLIAYGGATIGAAARYRDRDDAGSFAGLLRVYPTIHAAFGAGMLEGVARLVGAGGRAVARGTAPVTSAGRPGPGMVRPIDAPPDDAAG